MIKIKRSKQTTSAAVTFALPLDVAPGAVSVVGDFNGWDPHASPLRKRSNGTRSARIDLTEPVSAFKYLDDEGRWFNDPDAHDYVTNEYGEVNSIVDLREA